MATHRIRILHMSDLHERVALPWMDDNRKRKIRVMAAGRHRVLGSNFLETLKEIRASGDVHLVCFTGDIADWGLAEEYAEAKKRIDAILNAAGVGRNRLFIVPGNHDVNRAKNEDAWNHLRRLAEANPDGLSKMMAGLGIPYGAEEGWRDEILARTSDYHEWLCGGLDRSCLLPVSGDHKRLGCRVCIEDMGLPFPVHVIGLNSAWLAGDDTDNGKLLLTQSQVDVLATDKDGKPLHGFRLALMHHPLSSLADGADARRGLADCVDLLIHGHQHDPVAENTDDPDRSLRVIAAGSLYEGDEGDRWPNSFHVIDVSLDSEGRPLCYDVEFHGWSERGHWHKTGAIYKAAKDGRLTWWTPIGESLRPQKIALADLQKVKTFVGRESELQEIEKALLGHDAPGVPVAVGAVQGMPGVGKSYLASRFIQLHQDEFPGGILSLTLSPDEKRDADGLCRDLCDRLDLKYGGRPDPWDVLRDRLLRPKTLLLMENVDGDPQARLVSSCIQHLDSVAVLLTGRYLGLGRDAGWSEVRVRPFDESEALEQLMREWREPLNPDEKSEFRLLVKSLGYLPLAIHIAAGHLEDPGRTITGFLKLLSDKGLAIGPADPADHLTSQGARAILSATFDISLAALKDALGSSGGNLVPAFRCLGHAPLSGFGRSLGAAIAGLSETDFETLTVGGIKISLLEWEGPPVQKRSVFRLHPLLAELLKARSEREPVFARMTEWFVERLPERPPGHEGEQKTAWNELHSEVAAMKEWLRLIPADDIPRVERAGKAYAVQCGPFSAWRDLCERGLSDVSKPEHRSNLLWTLGQVTMRMGDPESALNAAQEKFRVDQDMGNERDAALARGLVADILQARGDMDEALRIRREEEIPVYERIGDARSRAVTMGKIADILQSRGDMDEALRIRREELIPVFERIGDVRSRAVTMGKIADILQARGDVDEALRIRREEEIPVYERIGDARSRAVTMGRIADILQARGDMDEALRIRREEEIPVYERIGDARSRAVTMEKIADILQARGDMDEALRIRREEQIPVFERIGDVRSRAVTMGKIADILYARGDMDESLRIRREEEIPVYERLGDVREYAVTMGKIADILQARGDMDEALRVLREEVVPVFERIGDVRSRAVTMGKIADILKARGDMDESLRIRREEQIPVFERLGDVREYAVTMGKIADILQARGDLDESLRVLREEVVPVFERIGDTHSLLVGQANLGLTLLTRGHEGDVEEACRLLLMAYESAKKMRIPEEHQIKQILESRGWAPLDG